MCDKTAAILELAMRTVSELVEIVIGDLVLSRARIAALEEELANSDSAALQKLVDELTAKLSDAESRAVTPEQVDKMNVLEPEDSLPGDDATPPTGDSSGSLTTDGNEEIPAHLASDDEIATWKASRVKTARK